MKTSHNRTKNRPQCNGNKQRHNKIKQQQNENKPQHNEIKQQQNKKNVFVCTQILA